MISLQEALRIVEKIDDGRIDQADQRFAPLYGQPFLAESLLDFLRSSESGVNADLSRQNFINICGILCPDFVSILTQIKTPELDTSQPRRHMA